MTATHSVSLPPLRPQRPAAAVLSPPRSRQPPRSPLRGVESPFARLVEWILYFWTVLAVILGLVLACLVLYLMYFKEGGELAPTLAMKLAAYGGLVICIASFFGLYGLVNHRKSVTQGRRNYSLGTFIIIGAVGAIVVIVAGAMALSLGHIVQLALEEDFSKDQVLVLESKIIQHLHNEVLKNPSTWRDTQSALECCGYEQVSVVQERLSSVWDSSLQASVQDVNAVGGRFCSTRVSECQKATHEDHCPVSGRNWCRVELLGVAQDNYSLLSTCAITFGAVQLLSSALGLFTLLCDVRRLAGSSPIYEIQHRILSPIQPNNQN